MTPTETLPLTKRFTEAFEYARAHHMTQERKGTRGVPYLSHLMAVAAIALENKATEDEAIAALLHDVVEDGGGPKAAQEVEERWGTDVAQIVLACSDSETPPGERKAPWKNRKEDYIASIATKSESTLLVSGSDKLHNARSILDDFRAIGPKVWERFNTTDPTAQLWYYGRLAEELTKRANTDAPRTKRLATELTATVDELRREVEAGRQAAPAP